jgi:hypothetical protein
LSSNNNNNNNNKNDGMEKVEKKSDFGVWWADTQLTHQKY